MRKALLIKVCLAFLLIPSILWAEITLTFNGSLKSGSTTFVHGTYPATVGIYSGQQSNTPVWSETHASITFSNGLFSIVLGNKDPANPLLVSHLNTKDPQVGFSISQLSNSVLYIPLTAMPYGIIAKTAETAKNAPGSAITGNFTTSVNMTNNLIVSENKLVVKNKQVGILTSSPKADLDVNGYINTNEAFHINGSSIVGGLSWRISSTSSDNIYLPSGKVGVGTDSPEYDIHVLGSINADNFTENGKRLSASLDWQPSPIASENIYFVHDTGKVGIGTINPKNKLHVNGAIRVGNENISPTDGMIIFSPTTNEIMGYANGEWLALTGLRGSGEKNSLVYSQNGPQIAGQSAFNWNENSKFLGINSTQNTVALTVQQKNDTDTLMHVTGTQNNSIFIITASGNIGINHPTPDEKLEVGGTLNADNFTLNGTPLSLAVSKGSLWSLNANKDVFYMLGNIGIGENRPQNILEIAQRNGHPDEDPAITFSSATSSYTMGIDSQNPDTFRVESGTVLGQNAPLFVAKKNQYSIGTETPVANLHISGNHGVVFAGEFFGVLDETFPETDQNENPILPNVSREGPGSRLVWHPKRGVFRAGLIEAVSPHSGKEWDNELLGKLSVAFALNNVVSGNFSSITGGKNNQASGAYATVLGGEENIAEGDFSLAVGRGAQAMHEGSFVWSDSGSAKTRSIAKNQFLIDASRGVGIGSNKTQVGGDRSSLVIRRETADSLILRLVGDNEDTPITLHTSGNMAVGTSKNVDAGLAVMGSVHIGENRSTANPSLAINYDENNEMIALMLSEEGLTTPGMLINNQGHLGFAIYPNMFTSSDIQSGLQIGTGSILAENYIQPDGTKLGVEPIIVWSSNATNDKIYFISGNVGIGATTPNSLLELSNIGGELYSNPTNPIITFDTAGQDIMSMGVLNKGNKVFRIHPAASITQTHPNFAVNSQNVGIATETPLASLHVSENSIFMGKVKVATADALYELNVPSLKTMAFNVRGEVVEASGTKWNATPTHIYKPNTSFTGIGTDSPQTHLDVSNDIKATNVVIKDSFTVLNTTQINRLDFMDENENSFRLIVEDEKLKLDDIAISEVLTRGKDSESSAGHVVMWVEDPAKDTREIMSETQIHWTPKNTTTPGIMLTSHNIRVLNTVTNNANSYSYNNQVFTGTRNTQTSLTSIVNLNHDGTLTDSQSYTARKTQLILDDNWTSPTIPGNTPFQIRGLDIALRNKLYNGTASTFTEDSQAFGLMSDVSNVKVQNIGSPGYKYAAIFMGDVGIGKFPTPNPLSTHILDIDGKVSANSFIISKRLSIATINVQNTILDVASNKRVGIGTKTPQQKLEVIGTIKATHTNTGELRSKTLNVNDGDLVVNATGTGIGTTNPNAQFHLSKTYTKTPATAHKSTGINTIIDSDSVSATGLDIAIDTKTNNTLGNTSTPRTATGLNINMKNFGNQGRLEGLSVKTNKNFPEQPAAIFLGGHVGIGVEAPTQSLRVNGTIRAKNVRKIELLNEQESASFNHLVVTSTTANTQILGHVTANNIYVQKITLDQSKFVVNDQINLPNTTLQVTGNPGLLIADNLVATQSKMFTLSASGKTTGKDAIFTKVAIGTVLPGKTGINSDKGITANTWIVSDNVTAKTIDINNNALFSNTSGQVGIGTNAPQNKTHVIVNATTPFIHIQNKANSTDKIAAGIQLIVDENNASNNRGSGIAAIQTARGASDLHFISDPENASPDSRLIIKDDGTLLIGRTSPIFTQDLLSVDGGAIINNSLKIGGTDSLLVSNQIIGASDIVISDNVILNKESILDGQFVAKTAHLEIKNTVPSTSNQKSMLYARSDQNDNLFFNTVLSDGFFASGNLTATLSVQSSRLPHYNQTRSLTDTAELTWTTENISQNQYGKFRIAASALPSNSDLHEIVVSINNSTLSNHTAKHISRLFRNRNEKRDTTFKGLKIKTLNTTGSSTNLDTNDTAYGLVVNMRTLADESRSLAIGSPLRKGKKIAARFNGGVVGIGEASPSAQMHIKQVNEDFAMQVQSRLDSGLQGAISVSKNSYVAIGEGNAGARLSVVAATGTATSNVLGMYSTSGAPLLTGFNNGSFAIGQTPEDGVHLKVHSGGSATASTMNGQTLKATLLNINNGTLVVTQNGNVGINTNAPTAQLDTQRILKTANVNPYTLEAINLSLADNVNQSIIGSQIVITSNTNSVLGANNANKAAKALNVNLSNLTSHPEGVIIGMQSKSTATQNAAVFMGGRVGIGSNSPESMLHVSGNIFASGNFTNAGQAADINIKTTTANHIRTVQSASFNRFIISTSTTPNIEVTETLTVKNFTKEFDLLDKEKTLADSVFLSAQSASINRIAIGTNNVQENHLIIDGSANTKKVAAALSSGRLLIRSFGTKNPFDGTARLGIHSKDDTAAIVQIDSTTNDAIFTVSQNGSVSIGTQNVGAKLNILARNTVGLDISNPSHSLLFVDNSNRAIAMGHRNPKSTLHIKGQNDLGLLEINNTLRMDKNGNTGVGGVNPEATLHIAGSFKVSSINALSIPSILVSENSRVAIRSTVDSQFVLRSGGKIHIGHYNGPFASDLDDVTANPGILFAKGSDHAYIGLRHSTTNTQAANIKWGSSAEDSLIFLAGPTTEVARMKDQGLAIGTDEVKAALSVSNKADTSQPLMHIQNASNPSAFFINKNGDIGIGTALPSANLHVIGSIKANGIKEATNGTVLTATTLNIVNNTHATHNFKIDQRVTGNSTVIGEEIAVIVSGDIKHDIVGVDFTILDDGSPVRLNNAASRPNKAYAYGLRVDMRNAFLKDPTFNPNAGQKHAAVFRGGSFGIGRVGTPNGLLTAVITNIQDGSVLSTGNIASFRSTANIIPGGSNDPGTDLTFQALAAVDSYSNEESGGLRDPLVPTNTFRAITYKLNDGELFNGGDTFYVDDAEAQTIMTLLKGGAIINTQGRVNHSTASSLRSAVLAMASPATIDGYLKEYIKAGDIYNLLLPFVNQNSFAFQVSDLETPSTVYNPLTIATGIESQVPDLSAGLTSILAAGNKMKGRVGINLNSSNEYELIDAALTISGDMRVGKVSDTTDLGNPQGGNKLHFSGGPRMGSAVANSDNEDPLWISRHNVNVGQSDLRVNLGEDHTLQNAVLNIGYTEKHNGEPTTWQSAAVIRSYSENTNIVDAGLGIGTTQPSAVLHVSGNSQFDELVSGVTFEDEVADKALVLIENTNTSEANGLLIRHSSEQTNGSINSASNFITFMASDSDLSVSKIKQLGSIDGNGDSGIQLTSPEADYAEYLPKRNPNEVINPGEVVGVFNGKISKDTQNADQIMVMSVAPVIVGNWQGKDSESKMGLVAFLGQVPVKVMGPVNSGDYIIASGKNNGLGRAISASEIDNKTVDRIVGRAWESSFETGIHSVNTVLGLPHHFDIVAKKLKKQNDLKKQIHRLRSQSKVFESRLKKQIENRQKQIDRLKLKVSLAQ